MEPGSAAMCWGMIPKSGNRFSGNHAKRRKATRLIQPSCNRLEPYNLARIAISTIAPSVLPILMLFASNVFMTFAWYGHLKFK
jgi:hypothetical protein